VNSRKYRYSYPTRRGFLVLNPHPPGSFSLASSFPLKILAFGIPFPGLAYLHNIWIKFSKFSCWRIRTIPSLPVTHLPVKIFSKHFLCHVVRTAIERPITCFCSQQRCSAFNWRWFHAVHRCLFELNQLFTLNWFSPKFHSLTCCEFAYMLSATQSFHDMPSIKMNALFRVAVTNCLLFTLHYS